MIEQSRLKQIESFVPEVLILRPLLYVGANANRFHFYDELAKGGPFDVLEIDPERCDEVRKLDAVDRVHCMDVRGIDRLSPRYDVILWSHGPSTIAYLDFAETVRKLENKADYMVAMSCPWGYYRHDPANEHDRNVSAIFPMDFLAMGYAVATLGHCDKNGSNILAWKYADKET